MYGEGLVCSSECETLSTVIFKPSLAQFRDLGETIPGRMAKKKPDQEETWERNHQKWQSKTALPLVNLSWLSKGDNGCLGCLACKLTKQANEYGNYEVQMGTNFSNVKRHAKSDQHQLALVKLGLIDVEDGDEEKAPSQEAFLKVAAGRLKGPIAWRHGEGGVGGRKKVTNMVKCLSQAMFEADRRFLARAGSIVLHMDVRALKLMIRFRAANSKLEGRRGIFGIAQLTRTTATVLQAALKQALRAKLPQTPMQVLNAPRLPRKSSLRC